MNTNNQPSQNRFTITTSLSTKEALDRLADNVAPKQVIRINLFNNAYTKPFEGKIEGNQFNISRIKTSRNSLTPKISGQISNFLGKTQVDVWVKFPTAIFLFLPFWLVLMVFIFFNFSKNDFFTATAFGNFQLMILAPFAILIIGGISTYLKFKSECRNTKEFFTNLLEGQEVETK